MKRPVFLLLFVLASCGKERRYEFSNEWLREYRIYVYGRPPVEYMEKIHASVVAWSVYHGGFNEEELEYVRELHSRGMKVASNFPTMQASASVVGNEDLERYACRDIKGEPVKALWIQPHSPYLPCHNNPLWQEFMRERIREHIDGEVDAIHFDEIEGTGGHLYIAGFCDYCMNGFREYLAEKYSNQELRDSFGIEDIKTFNYRDYLLSKKARGIWDDPNKRLSEEFVLFQLASRVKQMKELIEYARAYAKRPISFGANLYFFNQNKQIFLEILDFSVSENFIEMPPYGKYAGIYLLAREASGDKPVVMFPNILDLKFLTFLPRGWNTIPLRIMEAGATGGGFLIPHEAYVFGGGTATVTGAATAPPEIIRDYTGFLTENSSLIGGSIIAEVGILYDFSCALKEYVREGYAHPYVPSGKVHTGSLGMALYLQKKHIPFRFIYEGDGEFLKNEPAKLDGLKAIVVPYSPCEGFDRYGVLRSAGDKGIPVIFLPHAYKIWNGNEEGMDVFNHSSFLSTDADEDTGILLFHKEGKLLIHLLNYHYSPGDFSSISPSIKLCLPEVKGEYKGKTAVPGEGWISLKVEREGECFIIHVPEFRTYRLIVLEP